MRSDVTIIFEQPSVELAAYQLSRIVERMADELQQRCANLFDRASVITTLELAHFDPRAIEALWAEALLHTVSIASVQ
jgi:hypothetical protein